MPSLPTAFAAPARLASLDALSLFGAARRQNLSERHAASLAGVPRSTLRDQQARLEALDGDPEVAAFFSSAAGVRCLHRLLLAVHVGFGLLCPVGLPRVSLFLSLAGLDPFVGRSHGAQFAFASAVHRQVVLYGQHQVQTLGATMPARAITLAQDETFHAGHPLFVALEPLSGFVLVESYGQACDAATWDQKVDLALAPLPHVAVVQVSCDGGTALAAHLAQRSGVWRSPDVFHVLYDLTRGTKPALAAASRRASGARREHLDELRGQVAEAVQAMSHTYHPFDLTTGQPRTPKTVVDELHRHADAVGTVVLEAPLPLKAAEAVGKARRVFAAMGQTIGFVHREIAACMEALDTSHEVRDLVRTRLVPALYLQRVAAKTDDRDERTQREQVAERLVAPLSAPGSVWSAQSPEQRAWWREAAQACANLFQRASSATEGRNHLTCPRVFGPAVA